MEQKLVIVLTYGKEDPERVTLAFALANGAIVMETKPVIILQGNAVWLGVKGYAEHIHAPGFDPLIKLMDNVIAEGHRIMVCAPCVKERGILQDDLREGVFIGGAARMVEELLGATQSVTY